MGNNLIEKNSEYREKYEKKLDRAIGRTENSVIGFFIKNFRFTYLIILFIVIGGLYSIFTLPREAEPEVEVPFGVVTTVYPGANPKDIEELITDKLESKVKNLENLKRYNSESGSGFSSIFVEFAAEADLQDSFRKLREAVDNAKPELPDDAESPLVTEVNFNDFPIVTYSLVGDYSELRLKAFADIIQKEFESIPDVSRAPISGGLEREYQIIANQTKLANFNISLSQIIGAVARSNFSLPAGDIEIDGFKYGVRVKGRFQDINDLNDIVIATYDNSPVFLGDIAVIKDDYKEQETESRIGFYGQDSNNTISIQIYKKTGGNILNIVKDSQQKIDALAKGNILPKALKIVKTNDNSVFIKDDLRTLGQSALQTVFLITLILMLILSFRGALITAFSVPLAFLMSFIFLNLQGMTINSMVLFSLVLSLGLMVDNAIVIIEGINEYVTYYKKSIYEAALLSVWNFKWAITAGTMTTVAAFAPILLVSGILGEYMSVLPKTITATLVSSLFIALVVIPTLAARFIKRKKTNGGQHHRNKPRHIFFSSVFSRLQRPYVSYLRKTLPDKKKRRRLIAGAWMLFIIAVMVPAGGIMKIEMFPKIDLDYFYVNIELPVGSTLDQTRPIAEKAEKIVQEIPEIENYVTNIGVGSVMGFGRGGSEGAYLANIIINLSDRRQRDRTSYEVAEDLRNKMKDIPGAEITVDEIQAGPPSGAPIEVRVFGDSTEDIALAVEDISFFLGSIEGVVNVKDSIKNAAGEFSFSVDKQKANYYGLDVLAVASTIRNALYGTAASEINIGGESTDITVKYDKNEFNSVDDLENLLIFNNRGEGIYLKQLADIRLEPALLSISHRDGKRVATVSADIEKGVKLQKVLNDFDDFRKNTQFPANTNIEVGGETEDIEQSFKELFFSMMLAVILIAFILVLEFNSFRQPFIIIFSVPLAFIGVIFGLNLFMQPFSFTVFIGIVSLSGIVVNDAIVLIDRINKNIRNGLEFYEAIIEGGIARMQPIFLTSITTIAGVFPLIFASELWRGLSYSIIFGLIFSTVLILIVIPVIYASLCFSEKCLKK